MIWACAYGHRQLIRLLVRVTGIMIDIQDKGGRTAHDWAAEYDENYSLKSPTIVDELHSTPGEVPNSDSSPQRDLVIRSLAASASKPGTSCPTSFPNYHAESAGIDPNVFLPPGASSPP